MDAWGKTIKYSFGGLMKSKNIGYIDALKGIAILGVTMIHTGGSTLPGILGKIGVSGARGVQMFFIISAMLTFASLSNFFPNREDIKIVQVLGWYKKKILRLIPMYYLAIICSMLTKSWSVYWLGNEGHVTVKNILAHIFFIHGFFPHYTDSVLGIEWYLGVYVIFLIISPFLYKFVDCLEKSIVLFVLVYLVNPWLNSKLASLLPVDEDPVIYDTYIVSFGPLTQILVYTMGIVLYFLVERINECDIKHRKVLSYAILIFAIVLFYGLVNEAPAIYRFSGVEMFGLCFAIVIVSQAIYSSVMIDNPLFRLFGKYSYGIYLFQFIWINFYSRHINYQGMFDWSVKFLVCSVALLLISFLLTRFFDAPIQKLIKRIAGNSRIKEI